MIRPRAFISYRRDDSSDWAARISDWLVRQFGRDAVFIDTESLRAGDEWPTRIEQAVRDASVIIPIIGPGWLAAHDEAYRRRIDQSDDWVRRELEDAFALSKAVVPVLISGASMPSPKDLPSSLAALSSRQAVRVEDGTDIGFLVTYLLDRFDFRPVSGDLDYPTPIDKLPELTQREIDEALERLPEWSTVERDSVRGKGGRSIELMRTYKFKTFGDAIHFMANTARYIRVTGHHPFWENQYKDMRVRITTWDVGHRITAKDVRLAEYLDRHYEEYVPFDLGSDERE